MRWINTNFIYLLICLSINKIFIFISKIEVKKKIENGREKKKRVLKERLSERK